MRNLEPGDFALDGQHLSEMIKGVLELPPEALADEEVMFPICKDLADIIETQRTLIEKLDELFNDNLTTAEALEALADAGIPPPAPGMVRETLDGHRAHLSAIEALYEPLESHLSPQGRRDITAHIIDRRRVQRTVEAITDRYDDLMWEDEGI